MSTGYCTIPLYYQGVSRPCGRGLSDPCSFCKAFDKHKDEWERIFAEPYAIREMVEGDL